MKKILIVAFSATTLAGCATITRGTTNDLQITSEPSGAAVRTTLAHTCVTPCTLKVGRKDEFQVIFNKEGFKETTVPVRTQLANAGVAGVAGNVLVGGGVGILVDAYSGSALEHVPNPVHAALEPLRAESKAPPPAKGKKAKAAPKAATAQQVEPEAPAEPES